MLNTDSKTKTLLKESIGENLCGFELSKDFLARKEKAKTHTKTKRVRNNILIKKFFLYFKRNIYARRNDRRKG